MIPAQISFGPQTKEPRQRIIDLSMPEPNSGCWLWLGSISSRGYAKAHVRLKDGRLETAAYRISYMAFNGAIPVGLEVDHKCRNRACVNPEHLRLLTSSENKLLTVRPVFLTCKRGHPLSGDNVYLHGGRRHCKACKRLEKAARRARRRVSVAPSHGVTVSPETRAAHVTLAAQREADRVAALKPHQRKSA